MLERIRESIFGIRIKNRSTEVHESLTDDECRFIGHSIHGKILGDEEPSKWDGWYTGLPGDQEDWLDWKEE